MERELLLYQILYVQITFCGSISRYVYDTSSTQSQMVNGPSCNSMRRQEQFSNALNVFTTTCSWPLSTDSQSKQSPLGTSVPQTLHVPLWSLNTVPKKASWQICEASMILPVYKTTILLSKRPNSYFVDDLIRGKNIILFLAPFSTNCAHFEAIQYSERYLTLLILTESIVSVRRIPDQLDEFTEIWGKVYKTQNKNDIYKIRKGAYYETKEE